MAPTKIKLNDFCKTELMNAKAMKNITLWWNSATNFAKSIDKKNEGFFSSGFVFYSEKVKKNGKLHRPSIEKKGKRESGGRCC